MPYTVKGKCVYKKDGTKVGCTKGDVRKYLAALHINANESVSETDSIKGGKADKLSIEQIAKKFNVPIGKLKAQLQKGVKIEMEHTDDREKAVEIAMDHLTEFPDYYDRLEKMETKAKKDLALKESNKNLIKSLIRENLKNPKKKKKMLYENNLKGKTIINVDIQPEYEKWISFDKNKWVEFINLNTEQNKIIFLYNGYDTLGMIEESDYISWLYELGVDEDVVNNAIFYDKGYAFFRYCIDNSIDEEIIVELVKFMDSEKINDSRDIDNDMWNQFIEQSGSSIEEIRELLENSSDSITIPDLMDFLKNFHNIVLTGGGINQCLKEVEIGLLALGKQFNILSEFTY